MPEGSTRPIPGEPAVVPDVEDGQGVTVERCQRMGHRVAIGKTAFGSTLPCTAVKATGP